MNKFIRAAQTSQSLSLAAMEEASRFGLREAGIEHLFLALVLNEQSAGRALRELGIGIDNARLAVVEQHNEQLAALGVEASFPAAGQIVFHQTDGYGWSPRARDLIAKAGGKNKAGDAAAVLRELVAEPSGLISDILGRLGTTSGTLLEVLDEAESPNGNPTTALATEKGRATMSIETFVPASLDEVWNFLADPEQIPQWDSSIGAVNQIAGHSPIPGALWEGTAPTSYPDGKPAQIKPRFRRRRIELVTAQPPGRISWNFGYPDVARNNPVMMDFFLISATGGTQIHITKTWSRSPGWRNLLARPLRPIQKFLLWISLFQTGSAISRSFR